MKKITKNIVLLLFLTTGIKGIANSPVDYLKKVLNNLENIKSATYTIHGKAWWPGDTIPYGGSCTFIKEFDNPKDTMVGAFFAMFSCEEPSKLILAYDGKVEIDVFHEHKGLIINDFTALPRPFRLFGGSAFFNQVKNMIYYILTTEDNTSLDLNEFDDHYHLKLVIDEDKQVEFFGKPYRVPTPPFYSEPLSIYELWFSKETDLPYKKRREMFHNTSVRIVSDAEFNTLSLDDFNIYDYFPADYEIRTLAEVIARRNNRKTESGLVGQPAPKWILNDKNE